MNLKNLKIVINCMGMPFNGDTMSNGTIGGSETAAHHVARQLAKEGNEVRLFTNTTESTHEDFEEGSLTYLPAGDLTEQTPLGHAFDFYASNTPHDLLIIQRHKSAFHKPYAAKMKLLWLHDLGLHRDTKAIAQSGLFMDGVLVVSEYHKKQICKVYQLPEAFVHVLPNGVDTETVKKATPVALDSVAPKGKRLIYLSRPERGLDHLLKAGGIMEQMPDYHLFICTYNNVAPQMKDYYETLWRKAQEMPNVHNLGFLNKEDLYSYMKSMDLMIYPTPSEVQPEFREVSCIAVMEAAHCGLPVVTTKKGALPETLGGGGVVYSDLGDFPNSIKRAMKKHKDLVHAQGKVTDRTKWLDSVDNLEHIVNTILDQNETSSSAILIDRIRNSGISHLFDPKEYNEFLEDNVEPNNQIDASLFYELEECYKFYPLDSYADHYADYYQYEQDRGVDYGPENLDGNGRYNQVISHLESANLEDGDTVVDYGCAHGHYTINLAKRFPNLKFVGIDITASNIYKARKWAMDDGVDNVEFYHAEVDQVNGGLRWFESLTKGFSPKAIIAAEVLEHVRDPHVVAQTLLENLMDGGKMIITTPFGPWEAQGYKEHWPWRAHIHDFTRNIIKHMYRNMDNLAITCVPSGMTPEAEVIGSYVYSFNKPALDANVIDVNDAIGEDSTFDLHAHSVQQTLSLCMIVKDDWVGLARCLQSIRGIVTEVVVGLDKTGDNTTAKSLLDGLAVQHHIPVHYFDADSPMEIGFAQARNDVINKASGDWILWLDSDEELVHPERLSKYLHHNMYDAYSVKQEHLSLDPMGVIKTDYPAKLFRRNSGIKFFGEVHEHPEYDLNEGVGPLAIIPDFSIVHYGYDNEDVRRGRFSRNFDLLKRDRMKNPERNLGKFFWLRDMAQYCQFQIEKNAPPQAYAESLEEGFKIWKEVLKTNNLRMITESSKFYSMLVKASGTAGIHVEQTMQLSTSTGESEHHFDCLFRTHKEAIEYLSLVNKLRIEMMPIGEM